MRPARIASYAALAALVSAVLVVAVIAKLGVCPRFDEGAIECSAPVFEALGSAALTVLLLTVFGLPLSVALVAGGVVFMIIDASRWLSAGRRGTRSPGRRPRV